ncbi:uncharacterized protein Triagg1_282 [Trichoderma aggressivum f. europaeum]|uniref:Uncharacterized protein n=1 Tax=Trichoderma aggressivum f. europaeum TaxID=173218 RepID=A0AAE1ILX9_9HYPO|nr:hypothetical protein Triagg1_282 [Trichoderma aggressivum f. europaeum]
MEPIVYTIAGDGDTILVLENANRPIGAQKDDPVWENALPDVLVEEPQLDDFKVRAHVSEDANSQREIWVLLSSKKLALASPICKQMEPNNQPEIRPFNFTYKYLLVARHWDEKAWKCLEILANISVIVDHFQCHQTVKPFADKWIARLKEPYPTCYGRNLVLRLYISWVFLDSLDFAAFTKIIIRESRGPVHTLGLPIPNSIITGIDNERQRLIDKLFYDLYGLKKKLSEESRICSSVYPSHTTVGCATILPDALVEGMRDVGLTSPPQKPFDGYSIVALEKALRGFQQPGLATLMWSCELHGSKIFLPAEVCAVLSKQQFENMEGLEVYKFHRY